MLNTILIQAVEYATLVLVLLTPDISKMKQLVILFFLLFLVAPIWAQQTLQHPDLKIERPTGAKPWTNRNINDKPGQFQFAIVTDRTGGHRPGVFEDGVKKLNLLQPELVMSVGDLIEGYTTDTVELKRQWDEFCSFVDQLEMPFFFVPGNHDITNPVMEKVWEKRFGLKHYSFVYKDVLFMALNSEDQARGSGRGSISAPQLEWIRKTLDQHQQVKWTFLFMHQPLWVQQTDPVKWFDVEKLLANRKHTVFVGHHHQYVKYERNNSRYYILATTGGSSALRGPQFGEFDHFVWVTMTDQGPIFANLQLEGIFDDAPHTEEIQKFTEKIWSSEIIRTEPVYVREPTFRKDSIRFRLTNPFDVPVKVKLSNGFSWDMKTDLPKPEITLAPNSVSFLAMGLEARKEKPAEQLKSVKMKAEVAVQDGTKKATLLVPFEFNVAPVKRYELKKSSGKVTVDGKLDDWKTLPYTFGAPESAQFGVTYDDNFLYLGVQVNDAEIIALADQAAFRQDFVGFVIDGQPTAKSASDRGDDWFKNSIYFIASPEDANQKNAIWDMSEEEKALAWKCIRNKSGYAFEVAVPLSYIQKQQGNNWQTVRVNVVVQDVDKSGTPNSKRAFWQPNWREADNISGSGMFFR